MAGELDPSHFLEAIDMHNAAAANGAVQHRRAMAQAEELVQSVANDEFTLWLANNNPDAEVGEVTDSAQQAIKDNREQLGLVIENAVAGLTDKHKASYRGRIALDELTNRNSR